ncbi:hypothetical protein BDY21DRAFT_344973 [Lineolata rhizophorae]|uniref:Nudix hydrolase domain-containing protein n=1 Tax=Lineolata rhizophorae TaxID=578093 RepID=A0A6A6NZI9_9PEZI|nr:hypothetical protein BDY21DRAFT_344973 [Lineolata rhizophorae]
MATKAFIDLVAECDNFPYDEQYASKFYKLYLPHDDRPHGYMLPEVVRKMPWTPSFRIDYDAHTVSLQDPSSSSHVDLTSFCNAELATTVNAAIDANLFAIIHGQHSEPFAILGANNPIVHMERFAAPLFGIVMRGAHATAYTRSRATGEMKLWIPRRSPLMFTYPGKLDSTVAGGVRAGEGPLEAIVHEAAEEASLPEELVRRDVRAAGTLTYMSETRAGYAQGAEVGLAAPDCVYLYDLEVAEDVVLKPRDDEVKEFYLWGVEETKRALLNEEFKTNSAVVMIDFFVRHGIITQENEKDYVEIIVRMHRKLPFPTTPRPHWH